MPDSTWLERTIQRAPVVSMFAVDDALVVLGPDGSGIELEGDAARLAHTVVALLEQPRTGRALLTALATLVGGPIEHPETIEELLGHLHALGAIEHARPRPPSLRAPGPRIVLALCGAAASMHAPSLVQQLQHQGFRVRVAATAGALRFVRAEALESLTHHPVSGSIWPVDASVCVPHIELARWADAVVVCPASATTIARIATGDHDSIVSAIALATTAPVLIVPSMNPTMLAAAAVQRNLEQLVADGMHVAATALGVELADEPESRVALQGAAPPASVVVALLEAMLRRRGPDSRALDAEDWDAMYRDHLPASLPWHDDTADAQLLATVAAACRTPSRVLEIGCGLGTLACALAGAGHRVVATDLSQSAVLAARDRAADAGVLWVRDDITDCRIVGRFDAIVDRACLHGLSDAQVVRYAAAVELLLADDGVLVIKAVSGEGTTVRGAIVRDAPTIAAVFPWCELVEVHAGALGATDGEMPAQVLVFRRRARAHASSVG